MTMGQTRDTETERCGVAGPDAALLESGSPGEALGAYLIRSGGRSCVLPLERVQELTRGGLPGAAMSAVWWTGDEGWAACPAATACLSVGWRLESVTWSAKLVRFERIGADPGTADRPRRANRSDG